MSTTANPSQLVLPLRSRVTCPHCWNEFPPDRALWIAQHPDLVGDPRLGADQPQRFLPTRFNVQGAAIDSRGFACHGLACPNCHLAVPRSMFEMRPMFLSILGSPASGKSYFLAAMTWRLRSVLPKYFAVGFNDADPALNHRLHEYESLQFLNPNQESPWLPSRRPKPRATSTTWCSSAIRPSAIRAPSCSRSCPWRGTPICSRPPRWPDRSASTTTRARVSCRARTPPQVPLPGTWRYRGS